MPDIKNKIDNKLLLQMVEEGHEQKSVAAHMGVSPAAICKRLALLRKRAACSAILDILPAGQGRFVTEVALNGLSQTAAARLSYDCTDSSAKSIGYALMHDDNVSQAITEILAIEGVTPRSLAKTLRRHLDSDADPAVSLRAADMGFRLFGSYPATVTKNLNLHAELSPVDLSKYE